MAISEKVRLDRPKLLSSLCCALVWRRRRATLGVRVGPGEPGRCGATRRVETSPAVGPHIRLTQLTRVHGERVIGHDELDELGMHLAAHDLIVDVRDEVVGAQAGPVRRSLLVHLDDQVLDGVGGRVVVRVDLDGAEDEAEAARASLDHQARPLESHGDEIVHGALLMTPLALFVVRGGEAVFAARWRSLPLLVVVVVRGRNGQKVQPGLRGARRLRGLLVR